MPDSGAPESPALARPALVILACFLVLFVAGGSRFGIGLTLKPVVGDLGWGRSELGLAVALFQIVSAVAMFGAGYLVDRGGPRLVLIGGLIVSGVGIGLMSLMMEPWHALVLYGLIYAVGYGAASMIPIGVIVTRAFPRRTGIVNAAVMSGMSVGQLVMIAALAALMLTLSWRPVYLLLGLSHLILLPLLFAAIPKMAPPPARTAPAANGAGVAQAARSGRFWLLLAIYGICGFDDFFVATHVVAFAQDRGADAFLAGNLLALMGLTGLLGVVAGGALSDRAGPIWPTALCFIARVAVCALIMADQSTLSVAIFALVFGSTFMVTAPLTVIFVVQGFGSRHLGALTGLITMVHQMFGGLGAYVGAAAFDATGNYDIAFWAMLVLSLLATALTFGLRRPVAAG